MNLKFSKEYVFALPILLAMMLSLVACLSIQTTPTAATSDASITAAICTVWKSVSYSSQDTEQTQLEVRANNAARLNYGCK